MKSNRKSPQSKEALIAPLDCAGPKLALKELDETKLDKALELDQFFTKPQVALEMWEIVKDFIEKEKLKFDLWLEPSAGGGAFYHLMPVNKIGYDIDKKIDGVIEGDFLNIQLDISKKYLALGNPPFGKNSSLAIKFFNHCAQYCEIIAFIVPKTFKKTSVTDKLNKNFSLVLERHIEENSFTLEGQDKLVPCVFQIWAKNDKARGKAVRTLLHEDLIFTDKDNADFAFQRVGVNAGRIKAKEMFDSISSESHFFIHSKINHIQTILGSINWNKIKFNTAGNPSISKAELIAQYSEMKKTVAYVQDNLILTQNALDKNKSLTYCDNLCIIKSEFKTDGIHFDDNSLTLVSANITYTFKDKSKYLLFKKHCQ